MFLEIEGQLINTKFIERVYLEGEEYPKQPTFVNIQLSSGELVQFDYREKAQADWCFRIVKGVLKDSDKLFCVDRWLN